MVEVRCEYINMPSKGNDYFIFTNVEVKGHAEHTGHTNNIKVCAGISACCYGINRLVNVSQYILEYKSGYFHCYTNKTHDIKHTLDKDTTYALNTLVCQLYEIYRNYPNAFKKFDLIDLKELNDGKRKIERKTKPYRKWRKNVGFYSPNESDHLKEN